jgi:hypothetical protein
MTVFPRTLAVRIKPSARTADTHLGQRLGAFHGIGREVAGGIFLQGQTAVRLSVDRRGIAELVELGILIPSEKPHLARNIEGKE